MRLSPTAAPWQRKLASLIIPGHTDPGLAYDDLLRRHYRGAATWADAGCGRNHDILMAGDFTGLGVGFDLGRSALPQYLRASVYSPPFRTGSVDLATSRWVVEHLEDPESALRELHRALSPGGTLLIRTTNRLHYAALLSRLLPMPLKRRLVPADIFPTRYRLNDRFAIGRYLARHPEWELGTLTYIENLHYRNPAGFVLSVLTELALSVLRLDWLKSTVIIELVKKNTGSTG